MYLFELLLLLGNELFFGKDLGYWLNNFVIIGFSLYLLIYCLYLGNFLFDFLVIFVVDIFWWYNLYLYEVMLYVYWGFVLIVVEVNDDEKKMSFIVIKFFNFII